MGSSFTPAQRLTPAHDYCQGDSWLSESVNLRLTTNGITINTDSGSSTGTVLGVNETLSTPAGTFSTVRVRTTEDDGSKAIAWTAIGNGLLVRSEYYNPAGVLETVEVATLVD